MCAKPSLLWSRLPIYPFATDGHFEAKSEIKRVWYQTAHLTIRSNKKGLLQRDIQLDTNVIMDILHADQDSDLATVGGVFRLQTLP